MSIRSKSEFKRLAVQNGKVCPNCNGSKFGPRCDYMATPENPFGVHPCNHCMGLGRVPISTGEAESKAD